MALSSQYKIALKKASIQNLADYINEGRFQEADLQEFATVDSTFAKNYEAARYLIDQQPSPQEEAEFNALTQQMNSNLDAPETREVLNNYLTRWKTRPSASEHIAIAEGYGQRLEERRFFLELEKKVNAALSDFRQSGRQPSQDILDGVNNFLNTYSSQEFASEDIAQVNTFNSQLAAVFAAKVVSTWQSMLKPDGTLIDIQSIPDYLALPLSKEQREQADDKAWEWAMAQDDVLKAADRYDVIFQRRGKHSPDIARIQSSYNEWLGYAQSDIFRVIQFIQENPKHPCRGVAERRVNELKESELERIRKNPSQVPVDDFKALYNCRVFTPTELISAGNITSPEMLKRVFDYDNIKASLPLEPNSGSTYGTGSGKEGVTDVVLFGVAASGKTCVLSGLLRNERLYFDSKQFSGDYGELLYAYAKSGVALSGTPANFVATILAQVTSADGKAHYDFNLFEMAGEDFNNKIVNAYTNSVEAIISFEDMGDGAPEILSSDNDKLFFILIDPTISYYQERIQAEALRALVALMFGEGGDDNPNADIMKRVKGLHFIVTKSDTLKSGNVLEEARQHLCKILNDATRKKLVEGCREYGINASNDETVNGCPRVFPYSLGNFTVGNMYQYNPKGSDHIIKVICDYTTPVVDADFLHKFRDILVKPIF